MAGRPSDWSADQQAALRRVATLVASGPSPEDVFAAVTAEIGRVLDVDVTVMGRYDADGAATVLGTWTRTGAPVPLPVDGRAKLGGRNVTTLVFETGRPARLDSYGDASGPVADLVRRWGFRSFAGVPISVEGRLWGVVVVAYTHEEPLPMSTEARLAGFTELVGTAIANAQARTELRDFAEEQAALRRVATLVAQAVPPHDIFSAVAEEVRRLLKVDYTVLSRYDSDGLVTVVGGWADADPGRPLAIGLRLKPAGRNMHTLVLETGRPARIDDYAEASGAFAEVARDWEYRSAVGVPISVEDRLWGVMIVGSRVSPLPVGTEKRLAGFTELVATAIANAAAQAALNPSRARIVTAADTTRRQIERDLHDGAQQGLVSLALRLRAVKAAVPAEAGVVPSARGFGRRADRRTGRAARDRSPHPPGRARRGRSAAGVEDLGPPLRGTGSLGLTNRRSLSRTDRDRCLLRRVRGAHEHREARRRFLRRGAGLHPRRSATAACPRRRPRGR
jgi:GAF domain-containing protein